MKPTGDWSIDHPGQDNDPFEKDVFLRNNPEYWQCTNCGKVTKDIIFEEGDSNICPECYDLFEENEKRIRDSLPVITANEARKKFFKLPPLIEGREPAYISFPENPIEKNRQVELFSLAEKLSRKPLWLRLTQSYLAWRSNLLYKLGICYHCGWRKSDHAGVCNDCWDDYFPVDQIK